MRTVLILFASLTTVVMFLLASTSRNTADFSEQYWPLLLINIGLVTVIVAIIIYQLCSLIFRVRNHEFGSRLTLNLVGLFAALGIVPVLLVYIVSAQFLTGSIESWFNVRVEKALESGINLGQTSLDHLKKEEERKIKQVAYQLREMTESQQRRHLSRMQRELDVDVINIISQTGRILATASRSPLIDHTLSVPPETIYLVRRNGMISNFDPQGEGKIKINVIVPVSPYLTPDVALVQLITTIPESLSTAIENVEDVYRDYQEISTGREDLKRIYFLTLTMVSISTLFVSIALALYFSNRLAAPLSVLAEGTRAVAEGDFTPREAVSGADELALLTRSFNQMTLQLQEARQIAEKNRQDVESARARLENILFNLSTGVLAFDEAFRTKTINEGAQRILSDTLSDLVELPIQIWPRHREFAQVIYDHFTEEVTPHWHDQKTIEEAGRQYTLLIRGSRLPQISNGGYVVVFDDITQLIQAQKLSAWSEVAQRLAHEIKNPLTPIQLSAERILFKLGPKLEEQDESFLQRSTNIIVEQVAAMKTMVNSFRLYAKLPSPNLQPVNLNAFIEETLHLYDDSQIEVTSDLDDRLPPVLADLDQIRQVVHNLVQNGQDAQTDQAEPAIVHISTHAGERPLLIIEDNGPGFPDGVMKRAFEPYITTKPKGTGLGLAIVKRIIDEHHGTISLANKPDRGCKITISLAYAI